MSHSGFVRLERAVVKLVEVQERLRAERKGFEAELERRDQRVRELEEALLDSGQRRQDAKKAIEGLIERLNQIESEVMSDVVPTAVARGK